MTEAFSPVATLAQLIFQRSVSVFTLELRAVYFSKMKKNKHAKGRDFDLFAL